MTLQKTQASKNDFEVSTFLVLPSKVYSEFKLHIQAWCAAAKSTPFDLHAAYNIVPIAYDPEVAKYYKIPFMAGPAPWYDDSWRNALNDIQKQSARDDEKFKQFCGLCSFFRGSLNNHDDIQALEIRRFLQRSDLNYYFEKHKELRLIAAAKLN